MRTDTRFDLEAAVAAWRRLAAHRGLDEAVLDELESHLRARVAHLRGVGRTDREAFLEASARLGHQDLLASEFEKLEARASGDQRAWPATTAAMLASYLRSTARSLRKHPGYTFINVAGLAVGVACFLVIALFVADELRYDRFWPDGEQLYRVHETMGDTGVEWASTPWAVGDVLGQAVGDRVEVARLRRRGTNVYGEVTVRRDDRLFAEPGFFYADSTFFEVFALPLVQGDPGTALAAPASLVLTTSMAARYFGEADAMGQTLFVNDEPFTVTGVLRDLPPHAHLEIDFLASMSSLRAPGQDQVLDYWTFDVYYTYVKVPRPGLVPGLRALLDDSRERAGLPGAAARFGFMPVRRIHLHSHAERELSPNSDVAYVYGFSVIAVFLLGIGCINFVNLSLVRAAERAREIGVRKAMGAQRDQLMIQFIGEAMLLVVGAAGLGLVLAAAAMPLFNHVSGKALALDVWGGMPILLAGLVCVVGLLAGSYPALILSRFEPVQVLKGRLALSGRPARLRQGLVVAQFGISTFLVIGTLVVSDQLDYLRRADLGLDSEQVLVVPVRNVGGMSRQFVPLKARLAGVPGVQAVTGSNAIPGRRVVVQYLTPEDAAPEDSLRGIRTLVVDYGFVDTYGLTLVEGRDFSDAYPTDTTAAILLNEAAVRALGWEEDPIGRRVRYWEGEAQVVGVVKDFNYASLREEVEPLMLEMSARHYHSFLSVKLHTADLPRTLVAVEAAWQEVLPHEPFEYFFVDDAFGQLYRYETTLRRVFGVFAGLAILVACLGLFGLAAYTSRQRTKEIGIRKALGASAAGIAVLLVKDFIRPVAFAFVVAAPLAYLVMGRWLQTFAYHVDVGAAQLVVAGLLAFVIATLTVAYQSIRSALADPVESLRYE